MTLRLLDTLTRAVRPIPLSKDESGGPLLRLYVCGITPYDSGHMGHAFTYAAFDVLIRYLEADGVGVRYVQNVTDADTPLFERARATGVRWDALAQEELALFLADMNALGWRAPDVMPKVSLEIDGITSSVARLQAGGHTYKTDATYFAVRSYPRYGELSRLSRDEMVDKLRHEELLGTVGPGAKRDALDFPLWMQSRDDEPAWDSPFGRGRPGWHIECSAMSMRYLGPQLDLHGGGRDLVFSHHESERAQSESLTGREIFARHWMHTGLVQCDDEKMSKSRGNLVLVRDALKLVSPAALRLNLASHHYREDWNFEYDDLMKSAGLAEKARSALGDMPDAASGVSLAALRADALGREFVAALDEDMDTPRALQVFEAALNAGSRLSPAMLRLVAGTASLAPVQTLSSAC